MGTLLRIDTKTLPRVLVLDPPVTDAEFEALCRENDNVRLERTKEGAVRMNITLPQKTVKQLKKVAKLRERSAVIAEALDLYFNRQKETDLVRMLIEDYKSSNALSSEDHEWLNADLGEKEHED